jgi:hypothetical protein
VPITYSTYIGHGSTIGVTYSISFAGTFICEYVCVCLLCCLQVCRFAARSWLHLAHQSAVRQHSLTIHSYIHTTLYGPSRQNTRTTHSFTLAFSYETRTSVQATTLRSSTSDQRNLSHAAETITKSCIVIIPSYQHSVVSYLLA